MCSSTTFSVGKSRSVGARTVSNFAHVRYARRGIGGSARWIELAGGEDPALESSLDFVGIDLVGQIDGHQRREPAALRQRREDAIAIGFRGGDGRHRGHQVGHHNGPRKLACRDIGCEGQHGVVAQMEMPVIGFPNGEVCGASISVIVGPRGRLGCRHGSAPLRPRRIGCNLDIIEMVVSV
jgi:hypothetical protein